MASSSKTVGAAHSYAKALLELGNERQQAVQIGEELRGIREIAEANPTFLAFLRDPGVGKAERTAAVERILAGKLSPMLYNTIRVMIERDRAGVITQMAEQYQELLDEQLGKIEVDVTVAQRLDPQTLEQVRQRISAARGKDAVVHQYVDESIIGGLVLRVEDKLIDASVRSQLDAMKRQLMAAAPR